jgi:hypothetical protein
MMFDDRPLDALIDWRTSVVRVVSTQRLEQTQCPRNVALVQPPDTANQAHAPAERTKPNAI